MRGPSSVQGPPCVTMNWLALTLTLFLFADADVPRVNSLRPPANPSPSFPADDEIPLFPNTAAPSSNTQPQNQSQSNAAPPAKNADATLQESSKLTLIRYVSGEFAKAVKPLPAGKEGFHVRVGKPLEAEMLDRAVATHGPAVNNGDKVQITKLELDEHQIIVDFNVGGSGKRNGCNQLQICDEGSGQQHITYQHKT